MVSLSKIFPVLIYPLSLACLLLITVLLSRRWPRWGRFGVGLALMLLWVAGNHWVAKGLASSLEWRYPSLDSTPQAGAIVVLGGGTMLDEPPRPIVEINGAGDRIIYAAWLYNQGAADRIIVSGGRIPWLTNGDDPLDKPAEAMSQLLDMLGVPQEVIYLESESLNTYENARYSKQILDRLGVEQVLLVTSAMHMPRAVRLFEAQDLEVIPAPVDYSTSVSDLKMSGISWQSFLLRLVPDAGDLSLTTSAIKEYLGILYYHLTGWE